MKLTIRGEEYELKTWCELKDGRNDKLQAILKKVPKKCPFDEWRDKNLMLHNQPHWNTAGEAAHWLCDEMEKADYGVPCSPRSDYGIGYDEGVQAVKEEMRRLIGREEK